MVDSGRRRGIAASVEGGQGAECQSEGLAVSRSSGIRREVARGAGPELPDVLAHQMVFFLGCSLRKDH